MATSKLQRKVSQLLSIYLGQYTIRENTRPAWLITPKGERLELDFYIEELQVAIEVQGQQHYTYVPHFHKTYGGFRRGLERDNFKRKQCSGRDIQLVEIDNEQDAIMTIEGLLSGHEDETRNPSVELGRLVPLSHKLQKPKDRYYILACIAKYKRKIKRERTGPNRRRRIDRLTEQLEQKLLRLLPPTQV